MGENNHESDQTWSTEKNETSTLGTTISTRSIADHDHTVIEERGEEHVDMNFDYDLASNIDFDILWRHVLAYCQQCSEDTATTGTLDNQEAAYAPAHLAQGVGHNGLDNPSPDILAPSRQSSVETASTGTLVLDEARGRKRRRSSTSTTSTVDLIGLPAGSAPAQVAAIKRRRLSPDASTSMGTLKEEA